jgi:hypothetical protein
VKIQAVDLWDHITKSRGDVSGMVSIDKATHAPVEVAKLEHTPDLVVAKVCFAQIWYFMLFRETTVQFQIVRQSHVTGLPDMPKL